MEKTAERDALASVKSNANSISFEATQVAMNPPAMQLKSEAKSSDKEAAEKSETANTPYQFSADLPSPPPSPPPIQNIYTRLYLYRMTEMTATIYSVKQSKNAL